ncbi:hypothetical protein GCM10010313_16200 [Streptomyces violarus]|uniref:Secreted protein n=1 Tax=Streptomyces violarus TaxID=67380 RepID=A0A7W4ZMC1_9ACTN|nr:MULTISPECIES: hypothetical protein [Streptomyces]MBB3075147.1 hypothetical protein [Streptomyces violarus]WRT97781.1 hypothetical protein VJ737_08825 [Streptomyces sp. CGMCC 4.1772]GHD02435.1 hypothetical protein GCM10010313_16200 [Streptomyces violarus]
MKHRGRHRRRRRGRAVRATLAGTALALTAAATVISASQATVTDAPGTLKPLSASAEAGRLPLAEHRVPGQWLDRLSSAMGRPVGVGTVLESADRPLRDAAECSTAEKHTLPVEPAATRAYCFGGADTRGWRPGAVTTSGDADDDGRWGENRVILSGWTNGAEGGSLDGPAPGQGLAKVAFVDANDPDRLRYTWALLAVPVDGGRDYRGLVSPLSGMVWYQDKLLVTTREGDRDALYVYDMDRIQRATVESDAVGRVRGGWAAHGSRYVLPAVGSYTLPGGDGAPRPATVSLDRSTSPDSLVASEWVPADGDRRTRLWRYPLSRDPARTGLLTTDSSGHANPVEAYETKTTDVRGVLAYRSGWYLDRAAGTPGGHGTLWRQDTEGARATECGTDETRHCWSGRSGSLSYWEETGEVWSQSGRMLFALPLASIDRALQRSTDQ